MRVASSVEAFGLSQQLIASSRKAQWKKVEVREAGGKGWGLYAKEEIKVCDSRPSRALVLWLIA
jgi:hypothetical protein